MTIIEIPDETKVILCQYLANKNYTPLLRSQLICEYIFETPLGKTFGVGCIQYILINADKVLTQDLEVVLPKTVLTDTFVFNEFANNFTDWIIELKYERKVGLFNFSVLVHERLLNMRNIAQQAQCLARIILPPLVPYEFYPRMLSELTQEQSVQLSMAVAQLTFIIFQYQEVLLTPSQIPDQFHTVIFDIIMEYEDRVLRERLFQVYNNLLIPMVMSKTTEVLKKSFSELSIKYDLPPTPSN